MKEKKSVQVQASFTIEAAFIVPLAIFTMVGGIQIGYDLFQQAKQASVISEELNELDPVHMVRKNTLLHEYVEEHQ